MECWTWYLSMRMRSHLVTDVDLCEGEDGIGEHGPALHALGGVTWCHSTTSVESTDITL